jgi:hypothetical protein
MIKGMNKMCALDQSKLRESKIFSSLRNLQNLFSSKGLVKISASWFSVLMWYTSISPQIVAKVPEGLPHPKKLLATLSCGNVLGLSGG